MHIYVELWKVKREWLNRPGAEREAYMQKVGAGMEQTAKAGIEVVSWGVADSQTLQPAPYDFFAVWKMPSKEAARQFEQAISGAGRFGSPCSDRQTHRAVSRWSARSPFSKTGHEPRASSM